MMLNKTLILALAMTPCLLEIIQPSKLHAQETRQAFVIGNNSYPGDAALKNPVNDARAVTETLRDLGFDTQLLEDGTDVELKDQIAKLDQWFEPGGTAVFFYAGHAVQIRGRNYLLPLDVDTSDEAAVMRTSTVIDDIIAAMTNVEYAIIILDACRDNPFTADNEALGSGLASIEYVPGQTLVAYSTAALTTASDGIGVNSPYTSALVSVLQKPDLDIFDIFSQVRQRVRTATDGLQLPWISGSVEEAIVLHKSSGDSSLDGHFVSVPDLPAISYWRTIEDSRNPVDFEAFLASFADHPLTELASLRLAQLQEIGSPITPPVEFDIRSDDDIGSVLTACDVLASDDEDPWRLSPGIRWGLVNTRLALRACGEAVASQPEAPRLQFLMGRVLDISGRYDEARAFYRAAIDDDYPAAMVNLGYMALEGRGQEKDPETAALLYRQAALLGNPRARVNLGNLHLLGKGVEQSDELARAWTRLAAEVGWANAMTSLGDMYRRGRGAEQDYGLAADYYQQAMALGSHDAITNLARMYLSGNGVEKDVNLALRYFDQAVAAGNRFAPRFLGRLYEIGQGVSPDINQAMKLYELAADRGFAEGYRALGEVYARGEMVEADPAKSLLNYKLASRLGDRKAKPLAESLEARMSSEVVVQINSEIEQRLRQRR